VRTAESFNFTTGQLEALVLAISRGTSLVVTGAAGSGKTGLLELLLTRARPALAAPVVLSSDALDLYAPRGFERVTSLDPTHRARPVVVGEVGDDLSWAACSDARFERHQVLATMQVTRGGFDVMERSFAVAAKLPDPRRVAWAGPVFDLVVSISPWRSGVKVEHMTLSGPQSWYGVESMLCSDLTETSHIESALALLGGFTGTYAELLDVAREL
jgi:energy-coupling factor transporter ATP-binding protein EcfA2